jgi:hypothetical protein
MWQKVTFAGTCLVLSGALVMAQAPTRQIAPDPQQLQTQQQQTQQQQAKEPAHVQGQIVRVDPQTSTVVVRTSNGDKSVDREFKVETGTQYFGADHKPFFDGLTNKGWKQGSDVWYQLGTGNKQNTMTHMRLYNPATPPSGGSESPPIKK